MKTIILAITLTLLSPLPAYPFGEIFKIETTGTEYCGDFDVTKFNASNNVDLWVLVVSETELEVSLTPNFAPGTTFTMEGHTYLTGQSTAAFVAGVLFNDGSFATFVGTAKFNKNTGEIKSMTGTFVQAGVLDIDCFSTGKAKTAGRLN